MPQSAAAAARLAAAVGAVPCGTAGRGQSQKLAPVVFSTDELDAGTNDKTRNLASHRGGPDESRMEIAMKGFHCRNVLLAAAAALMIQSLSLPAEALGTSSQAGSIIKVIGNPEASTAPALAAGRAGTWRLRRPNQQVVAFAPILFLGVGW